MAVACPYCQFVMSIRGAGAGRYTPACQQCKKKFLIIVPAEVDTPPTVKTFEDAMAEVHNAGHTREHAKGTSPPVKQAAPPTQAPIAQAAPVPTRPTREHPASTPAHHPPASPLPESLGGYKIEKKLGEGGMGAVYLARQISLDRPVAVKVMNPEWAGDPDFIARFTREAYAAAQLTHHNIVQIYDIGVESAIHYFSMELVPGQTLSALVHDRKRLDPEEAAGYTLQAARGLKFAHDHGMVHRDIKPENLLLNEQGIVKVLDLGLVKTPHGKDKALQLPTAKTGAAAAGPLAALATGTTQMNVSMGTPDYMSPEQAQDAAGVDPRADIYSLGCTLYDFVVGRPPFVGKTVLEVLTKHASEPLTPPELLVKRVPAGLSHIVQRMVEKKREARYESMDAVIHALEAFLGVSSSGPFSPTQEHASLLEQNVEAFNHAPLARLRKHLWRTGLAAGLLLTILLVFLKMPLLAGSVAGLLLLTAAGYQVVVGISRRTHVFTRVRQLAFGAKITDWLKVGGLTILALGILWILGLLWAWIAVAVLAAAIALAMALGMDAMLRRQRHPSVTAVQALLKTMRMKGLDEDALRQFVCRYSDRDWEEFYETLFGYEAKMQAREAWGRGEGGRERKKFAPWRDGLIAWADRRMKDRREARERAMLEALEEKRLRAQGISRQDARKKAQDAAGWMVDQAGTIRDEKRRRNAQTAAAPRALQFVTEPSDEDLLTARRQRSRVAAARSPGGILGFMLLGPHVRLALGLTAIAVCMLWLHHNDSLGVTRVRSQIMNNFQGGYYRVAPTGKEITAAPGDVLDVKLPTSMKPLAVPLLTVPAAEKLFNGFSWGIAGILLVLASFWRGVRISLLIVPAALLMIAGAALGLPALLGFQAWAVAYALGGTLALAAFWWGREPA